jgi:peptide/nickel transport system ATP-binding protein
MVPDPYNLPPGCPFHPRCDRSVAGICNQMRPSRVFLDSDHEVRCLLYGKDSGD